MYEDFTLTFLIITLNLFEKVEFFNIVKENNNFLCFSYFL